MQKKETINLNESIRFDIQIMCAKIKSARRAKKVSVRWLANETNISLSALSHLENGKSSYHKDKFYEPKISNIIIICKALDIKITDIIN